MGQTPVVHASDSRTLPSTQVPMEIERQAYEDFIRAHAARQYRGLLTELYGQWHQFNQTYFEGRLRVPHLAIGRTSPRRYSHCRLTTDYGGALGIILSEGIAFGTNQNVVRRPWPAAGAQLFLADLLLAETVKQFVLEAEEETEDGYGGYGPRFATIANRIGQSAGIRPVVARRRSSTDRMLAVAANWPWAGRQVGYYQGDIVLQPARIANGAEPVLHAGPIYEYFLFLMASGRTDRLRRLLERQVDFERELRSPALRLAERGPLDENGRLLPMPMLEAQWVLANDGLTARIAMFIRLRRRFDVMPILSDALQEVGCVDPRIIEHCQLAASHTSNCWVLGLLLHTAAGNGLNI